MLFRHSKQTPNLYRGDESKATFHLSFYYYMVELVGFVVPISIAMAAFFFPGSFQWVSNYSVSTMIVVLLIFGLLDAIFLICHELTGKNFFFNLNRYLFVCFYIFIIIVTGDVNSSFIFVLIFPSIVSAVYLDQKVTRNIGIFLTILFAGVIFFHPMSEITIVLVTKHIFQTILIGTISWLMYRIVVETLSQKFEKEDTARKLAELVHVDQIKNDFLSVAQHRLRTPLTGAKFALETILEDKDLCVSSKTLIDDGLDRVREAIVIVNEMLTTAEDAGSNFVTLIPEEFDLSRMVNDIVGELSFLTKHNSNSINLNIQNGIKIKADRKKIYAALSNVVNNALLYTRNGQVSIALTTEANQVVCMIKDDGIGIDNNDLPYIFERMHRGRNAVMLEPNESGIGLYVSKKMIEMHRGTIKIDSTLGKGTLVTVTLPLNPD